MNNTKIKFEDKVALEKEKIIYKKIIYGILLFIPFLIGYFYLLGFLAVQVMSRWFPDVFKDDLGAYILMFIFAISPILSLITVIKICKHKDL